jgi:hypothetical protein
VQRKLFRFCTVRGGLGEVMSDRGLASLGDAYVNFVYSLALSNGKRKPLGGRARSDVLAQALRKAELRPCLGSGMTKHRLADAAEALLVYGWLNSFIMLDESVAVIEKARDAVEGFAALLETVKNRVTFP